MASDEILSDMSAGKILEMIRTGELKVKTATNFEEFRKAMGVPKDRP